MDRGGLAYAAAFVVALIAAAVAYDAISAWAVHQAEDVDAEAAAARRAYTFLSGARGGDAPRVIVIGASDAREGVDAYIVDRLLRERGLPHETFNLAVGGDTPLRRIPELPLLVEARPALVVYTVGPFTFRDTPPDGLVNRFMPVAHLAAAPAPGSEAAMLLGPAHIEALDPPPFARLSPERLSMERQAIRDALRDAVASALGLEDENERRSRDRSLRVSSVKDPWTTSAESLSGPALEAALASFPRGWETVGDRENENTRAFELVLRTLAEAGIPTLVVESPLNPAFDDLVPADSLAAFRARAAEASLRHGVPFVGAQGIAAPDDFADHVHANRAGREKLSARLADLVAGLLEARA
ncbi:MAG TPA: hypothetical protein VM889_13555 [Candidatus Thermoplasmatota archaeon]|nr:hypothetical protein [Candidatus Thermoplasmatota archaeon]